jgi:hypothetical protein
LSKRSRGSCSTPRIVIAFTARPFPARCSATPAQSSATGITPGPM